ncbi:MAG: hypothetical protein FJ271_09655 [Planctomycetes bacterium]|nr:hypothetical protein [Planctomycetota bacterium]
MLRIVCIASLALCIPVARADEQRPRPLVTGLKNPESVAVGGDRRIYSTEIGEFGKDGDGRVLVLVKDKAVPFVTGLDDPKGMVFWVQWLFVTDNKRIWRIDAKGKAEVFRGERDFPWAPSFLNDIAVDEEGTLYVSDSGDLKGGAGALFRVPQKGKITVVAHGKRQQAQLHTPNGLVMDGKSHLLMVDFGTGELQRIRIGDGTATRVAGGFGGGDGLAWDMHGRLFISDWKNGKLFVIPRPGQKPVLLASGFESAADICLAPTGKSILVPEMKAGTLTAVPVRVPGHDIDETPLQLKTAVAFPDLTWTGWKGETDDGKVNTHRPLVLTHAGDGSKRVFVATQHGVVHVFPGGPGAKKTDIFLDIQKRVVYSDKQNEEGFLGLAFHPRYASNGQFFAFYTTRAAPMTNVLSRFKVSKDDPSKADPKSEEVLLTVRRPYWNHDGGTICFGPDGFLYVALGDGGAANDPHNVGQNLKTPLGKILRIDVDRKSSGKMYAVPEDNPFVGKAGALPETWAYGLRNVWRMAFDRKTGKLWAADVGQNLYEEINIITRGGNYGWSIREGLHPFGARGVGPRKDLIDPIWEYHHDIGKSITGGPVYRGKRLRELQGSYLYADYITGKIWALRYDEGKQRVVANRPIPDPGVPVLSFGEDEDGEVYFLTTTASGRGILEFRAAK